MDLSDDRQLDRAMKGEGRVWLAHPASLGHGVDGLQEHCNIIAFFSHWWSLEEHDQIIERIGPTRQMQAGKNRAVFVYYIIAAGTVDELVRQRQTSKRSTQDILLEAMKRKTT
jgi:SNF2 family DNA or RNA helicase